MKDEELALMLKEHQARLDWAAQEKLVGQIYDEILKLPLEARRKLFAEFCINCGINNPECKCTDEKEEDSV